MANNIKCPQCGHEFEISSVISASIKSDLERELRQNLQREFAVNIKSKEDQIRQEIGEKTAILQAEIDFKDKKMAEMRDETLKLHQERMIFDEERKNFEIEKEKQLKAQLEDLREKVNKEISDQYHLRDLEKDKQLQDMKKMLEEAQRKANQGSQQLQGEVQELDLELELSRLFPTDSITPIAKGMRGADISQTVCTQHGNICGVILWESKRTKDWKEDWISKLKDDMRNSKSNTGIIVTQVMPKGTAGFIVRDGICVVTPEYAITIASLLRQRLIDIAKEKFFTQNRQSKSDLLYNYIVSHEFQQQIESVVEVYQDMNSQIQKERAAFEKIWKERESQAARLLHSTAGIVGSVQGLIGQTLPQVKGLDILGIED